MEKYQNVIIDTAGNAISGVTVTVYLAGTTTPATLFSNNISTAKANPYVTDSMGNVVFYAANGRYDIKLTKTGYTFGTDLYDTCLFDSADYTPATSNESALNNLRLVKSGADLTLQRISGSLININGTIRAMVTAPTLAPTTLDANTTYYIYAYWSGTDVGIEPNITSYTLDAATGRPELTGDTTRRLVGIARPIAGPAWADDEDNRFVLSREHRRPLSSYLPVAAPRTCTQTSFVELHSSDRLGFLTWSTDEVQFSFHGLAANSSATTAISTSLGIDNASQKDVLSGATVPDNGAYMPVALTYAEMLADGYHYVTPVVKVSGGTGTWHGSANTADRCVTRVTVMG